MQDFFTAAQNARRSTKILTEPWFDVREINDLDVLVPADYPRIAPYHAIIAHPDGITVRNCRILYETPDTWLPRWLLPAEEQPALGIDWHSSGLVLPAGCRNVYIDGLHIEGCPHVGILGVDCTGVQIRRYSAKRCHYGGHFSKQTTGNRLHFVENVRIWAPWGPEGVGQDGWVGEGYWIQLRRFEVEGAHLAGAKLVGPGIITVARFQAPNIQWQGNGTIEGTDHLEIRASELFLTGTSSTPGNRVQIAFGVTAFVRDGYIINNDSLNGCAIQATGNVSLDMRGVTIGAFNGLSNDGHNPASALELDVRPPPNFSTVNSDFETVNSFWNQNVLIRRAT